MNQRTAAQLEEAWRVMHALNKEASKIDELVNKLPLLPITRVTHHDHIQGAVHRLHLAIADVWQNIKFGKPLPNFCDVQRSEAIRALEKSMLIETADGNVIADSRIEWFWPREGLPIVAYVPDLKDSDCFGYVELKARTLEELEGARHE